MEDYICPWDALIYKYEICETVHVIDHIFKIKYTSDELKDVIKCSLELLKQENTLAEINPPIVIVGDIHGQYFDLLRMFSKFSEGNQHGSMRVKYIFLGDYVDRGRRSMECVCLVLTLKILFPRKYQLLRGNHECKGINRVYGFYDEILDRFEKDEAERLWLGFNEVFAWLPLAGLVGKKILCMHGGISAYLNSLDDIRKASYFSEKSRGVVQTNGERKSNH
ncbi:phosphoprotein phosphatase 1 domain protein [Ancylostoma caninum]|uniref:Serine/threonine-protein phosphatase n=1 Tax=Ancylostoma caninum TaxID=29170 RepID=A0A368GU93_ANCCA|nr:phosphoprotein phosphatase 1 domain protein [Ancylostoma caninum]